MLWIITTCLLTFTIRWVGFFFCLWLQWRNIREQKDLIKKRKVCVCIWGGGHCCNSFQTNFHLKWTEIFLHHGISWKDGFRQKMLILLIQGWSSEGFPAGRRLVSQVISPLTTQQHQLKKQNLSNFWLLFPSDFAAKERRKELKRLPIEWPPVWNTGQTNNNCNKKISNLNFCW